jgi:hypothetical protein
MGAAAGPPAAFALLLVLQLGQARCTSTTSVTVRETELMRPQPDGGAVYSVGLQNNSSQSATRWWKETETYRILLPTEPSICLDAWGGAVAIAAQSCDHAGNGPSNQRLAYWANDSSVRWLPVQSPGHAPEGMTCLWQNASATSATMQRCDATVLVTDQSGQWQWDSATSKSTASPIVNRRSGQHLQLTAAPAPPPGPKPPPLPNAGTLPWVNWNLSESHGFEYIEPSRAVRFAANQSYISLERRQAIVGLDWTVSVGEWFTKPGVNHANCEAVSRENCRRIKAAGMTQRCCIYHNQELALGWLESQAAAMDDPSKADYFLQYTDGNGTKNGTIYAEDIEFGRQWFWDHTNAEASEYFVSSVVESLKGDAADCTFTDDTGGLPAEHPAVMGEINMTPAQLSELQHATALSFDKLVVALVKAGKYDWQRMTQTSPFSKKTCASWMETYCEPKRQSDMMVMASDPDDSKYAVGNASIAAFLITRPPVGFMATRGDSPTFLLQPGVPKGLCLKEGGGVYSRQWTNGIARLDCAKLSSELPFPSLKTDDEARPHIVTVLPTGASGGAATPATANPDAVATVHEAAAEVRRLLVTHAGASVEVHLLPGVHHVGDSPLRLGKQDGAAAGSTVTWKSADASDPASLGAPIRVLGWKPHASIKGAFTAPLPGNVTKGSALRQLWVGGARAERPRIHGTGIQQGDNKMGRCLNLTNASNTAMYAEGSAYDFAYEKATDPSTWPNPQDVEFLYTGCDAINCWVEPRCTVQSVEGKVVSLQQGDNSSCYHRLYHWDHCLNYNDGHDGAGKKPRNPTTIENVATNFTQPGQFYYDRKAATISYIPRPGETPDTLESTATTATQQELLVVNGSQNVRWEGVQFQYATWLGASGPKGYVDTQSAYLCNDGEPPVNVHVWHSTNVTFRSCAFQHLGGVYAIGANNASQSIIVSNCTFTDCSGGAVKLGNVGERGAPSPGAATAPAVQDRGYLISDNLIHDMPVEYSGANPIFIGYTADATLSYNTIHHSSYSAICAGWGWGMGSYALHQPEKDLPRMPCLVASLQLSDLRGIL